LNGILTEERRRKAIEKTLAEAGPFDVFDKDGNLLNPGSKLIKPKIKKVKKSDASTLAAMNKVRKGKNHKKIKTKNDGEKSSTVEGKKEKGNKKLKEESASQLGFGSFKAGKSGQLRPGWPHFMGIQLMLRVWKLTTQTPDQNLLSRARPYFDAQTQVLCSMIRQALGLDPISTKPSTPQDIKIALASLNLVVLIAEKIVKPANKISDVDVQTLLNLHGDVPKPKKTEDKKQEGKKKKQMKSESKSEETHEEPIITFLDEVSSTIPDSFYAQETEEDYFRRSAVWYNPNLPEFFFDEAALPGTAAFLFTDGEPTMWTLEGRIEMVPQPVRPNTLPPFYPELLTRRTATDDVWFIPSGESDDNCGYSAYATIEIFELISDTLIQMITIPELSISRLMELLHEICLAISLSHQHASLNLEDQIIDDKRTIILEQLFVKMIGSNFRDFNDSTKDSMRTLCYGAAKFIRQLYDMTSKELWRMQQHPEPEDNEQSENLGEPEPEEVLYQCREWITYLDDGCNEGQEWVQWLKSAMQEETLTLDVISDIIEDGYNWIQWGKIRQRSLEEAAEKSAVPECQNKRTET